MDEEYTLQEIMETVKRIPPEDLPDVLEFLKTLTVETGEAQDNDWELLTMG